MPERGGSIGKIGTVRTSPGFSVGRSPGLGGLGREVASARSLGFTRSPNVRTETSFSFGQSATRLSRSPGEGVFTAPKAALGENKRTVISGTNLGEGLTGRFTSIPGVKSVPRRFSAYAPTEAFSGLRSNNAGTSRDLPASRPRIAAISDGAPGNGGRREALRPATINALLRQTTGDALQAIQRQTQRQQYRERTELTGKRVDMRRMASRSRSSASEFVEKRIAPAVVDAPPIHPREVQNPVHREVSAPVSQRIPDERRRAAIHEELIGIESAQTANTNVAAPSQTARAETPVENIATRSSSDGNRTEGEKPTVQIQPRVDVHSSHIWIRKQQERQTIVSGPTSVVGIDIGIRQDSNSAKPEPEVKKDAKGILGRMRHIIVIDWIELFDNRKKKRDMLQVSDNFSMPLRQTTPSEKRALLFRLKEKATVVLPLLKQKIVPQTENALPTSRTKLQQQTVSAISTAARQPVRVSTETDPITSVTSDPVLQRANRTTESVLTEEANDKPAEDTRVGHPGQGKVLFVEDPRAQENRRTDGQKAIMLSFSGTDDERIDAAQIADGIPTHAIHRTSEILLENGLGDAVEARVDEDPTDTAVRNDIAGAGMVTRKEAHNLLEYALVSHRPVKRVVNESGNPVSKKEVAAVLGTSILIRLAGMFGLN